MVRSEPLRNDHSLNKMIPCISQCNSIYQSIHQPIGFNSISMYIGFNSLSCIAVTVNISVALNNDLPNGTDVHNNSTDVHNNSTDVHNNSTDVYNNSTDVYNNGTDVHNNGDIPLYFAYNSQVHGKLSPW